MRNNFENFYSTSFNNFGYKNKAFLQGMKTNMHFNFEAMSVFLLVKFYIKMLVYLNFSSSILIPNPQAFIIHLNYHTISSMISMSHYFSIWNRTRIKSSKNIKLNSTCYFFFIGFPFGTSTFISESKVAWETFLLWLVTISGSS